MSSPKVQRPQVPASWELYHDVLLGEDILVRKTLKREPSSPGKCGGCGSRHFVTHHERRICAYCRGEQ